jgi:hypothetical protein
MMTRLLNETQSYTFSKIFDLKIDADELAADFGYSFERKRLQLPQYQGELSTVETIRTYIESVMPYVNLANETSRREILVAPVILEVVRQTRAELKIEYPIKVTEQLQGILDYFLRSQTELLVIEAKREDLDYGFTQLVSEMIALDRWERSTNQPILIGAVTTGEIWRFASIDRAQKHIIKGLELYRIPEELETLLRILIQVLGAVSDH